ncbi:MAG: MmgE/PrpD family protein [Proteobacteria bacterium]|nr:MmgE/PrpD family protein [Pseudomonadota bacterium]
MSAASGRADLEGAPEATRLLGAFAAGLAWSDLPGEVVAHAKLCALDAVGCCLFGAGLPWTRTLIEVIAAEHARPEAAIFGAPVRTSAALAALANGTAGHAFELDDLHTAGLLHVGTLAVPAALALAEARGGVSGRELIAAIVAGFEVGLRVGMAGTHSLFHRGFHPQGTSGVFAAAASAARVLRLDLGMSRQALAIGASQAAGLMAAQAGAMTKRLHSGRAAQGGVYAALLAERGFSGIGDAIEAPYGGFLSSYTDRAEPERLVAGLGRTWETLAIGFKPNPTVSCIQGPLKALRSVLRDERLAAADIDRIEVRCSTFTHKHSVWPYAGADVTEAQMNMAYGLAVTALDGEAFVAQYGEERIRDPRLLAFARRIEAVADPGIDALGPSLRDAIRLTVHTRDGRAYHRELRYRPGSPEDPMSAEEVRAKFAKLCEEAGLGRRADAIAEAVARLDRLDDARELSRLLAA